MRLEGDLFQVSHKQYVPVLKLKPGEKQALRRLPASVASSVVPLFEIIVRAGKPDEEPPTIEEHLDKALNDLADAVGGVPYFFLDCREIAGDGPDAAQQAFQRAAHPSTLFPKPFVPVTSVTRTVDVAAALSHAKHGLALRISKEEFEAGILNSAIPTFLKAHGLQASNTDLIIDLGAVDHMVGPGVEALSQAFLADIPHPTSWRSLIVSACDFPSSLGDIDANSHERVARTAWACWRDDLYSKRTKVSRLPTFSDCGIQHRDGVEGVDFTKIKPSAAIRYAETEAWFLTKGVNIRDNGGGQFRDLAQVVIDQTGAQASHCGGCHGLHEAAENADGYGALQKWRELGTLHHITLTVENLAALPWP